MKIIFCARMYSDIEKDIRASQNPNSVSGHKFQENMLRGLLENTSDIEVINSPRVPYYPRYYKRVIRKSSFMIDGKKCGVDIGIFNYFVFNYISQFVNTYREVLKMINASEEEKIVLITFNSYVAQSLAMMLVKKRRKNVILCDVIGDLHGKYGIPNSLKGVKGLILNLIERYQDHLASKFDCYVFLSKYMKEAFVLKHKKYVVVEGFAQAEENIEIDYMAERTPKRIFYAGSLLKEYGILHLLRAFSMIEEKDYELVIAGEGSADKIVKEFCKRDTRIKYAGLLSPGQVREYQQKSTVLVSPRLPDSEFVKYSFPSKTMECLASGIPYVAHKLPCDPPEYKEFIQYADGKEDEDLKNAIVRICEMKPEDIKRIGMRGRSFIINKKNPKQQCKRIIKMLEQV